jgi:hypothetical protein
VAPPQRQRRLAEDLGGVPEKTLSDAVSMVGTLSKPFNSLSVILRHASNCYEHHREDDLSVSVPLLGERAAVAYSPLSMAAVASSSGRAATCTGEPDSRMKPTNITLNAPAMAHGPLVNFAMKHFP